MSTATKRRCKPPSASGKSKLDRYAVKFVLIDSITPSPENDEIYGPIEHDDSMDNLIDSMRRKGMEEPILLTADRFILSGHRRHYAAKHLGWKQVPVRVRPDIRRIGNLEYHRELIEYNPQRVKTVGSILREALLRDNDAADTYAAIRERREASLTVDADFMTVSGEKEIEPISRKQQEFLAAVQRVLEALRPFWPVTIRKVHYGLVSLNPRPFKLTPERSKFSAAHYRYKNDKPSYNALVRLLKSARYLGYVPMTCIDDPTRPQKTFGGFDSVAQFVQQEIDGFLTGFHRNRQLDQPRHIEVFGEKNTLFNEISRACAEYYVPFSLGRGFCSVPVWRDIEKRFRLSGKERMTLIVVSDYDPAGFALAEDAIRSLRDLHNVPVDGHRIAVTKEQIKELDLAEDFNPAKEDGERLNKFVRQTGGAKTWEVEALGSQYLVEQIKAAIEANMDMEVYDTICDQEEDDCEELCRIREQIASQLEF